MNEQINKADELKETIKTSVKNVVKELLPDGGELIFSPAIECDGQDSILGIYHGYERGRIGNQSVTNEVTRPFDQDGEFDINACNFDELYLMLTALDKKEYVIQEEKD